MKRIISFCLGMFLFFGILMGFGSLFFPKDVGREAAKYVVAFKSPESGKIYATGFHIEFRGKVYIITNKHVCNAGTKIFKMKEKLRVDDHFVKIIKVWEEHDLCALESWKKDGLELSDSPLERFDKLVVVGHPRGLPLVIREGRIIAPMKVYLASPLVYGNFEATQISALIYGGNSGSPVLNSYGEVVGVIFAGHPFFPHEPATVPHKYLTKFLDYLSSPEWFKKKIDAKNKKKYKKNLEMEKVLSDLLRKLLI